MRVDKVVEVTSSSHYEIVVEIIDERSEVVSKDEIEVLDLI